MEACKSTAGRIAAVTEDEFMRLAGSLSWIFMLALGGSTAAAQVNAGHLSTGTSGSTSGLVSGGGTVSSSLDPTRTPRSDDSSRRPSEPERMRAEAPEKTRVDASEGARSEKLERKRTEASESARSEKSARRRAEESERRAAERAKERSAARANAKAQAQASARAQVRTYRGLFGFRAFGGGYR